jgi:hypothetical protein
MAKGPPLRRELTTPISLGGEGYGDGSLMSRWLVTFFHSMENGEGLEQNHCMIIAQQPATREGSMKATENKKDIGGRACKPDSVRRALIAGRVLRRSFL